ncbi:hypothetical protein ACFV4N_35345, partial [Actinosynnema sp. NPDC059797]
MHGHVYYVHAPWSLSSISQAAFWPERDFRADYGDGTAADCVSVVISDWDTPGVPFGRPAKELTEEQILQEVPAQLKQHLNDSGRAVFDESSLVAWFLDPGLSGLGGPNPANADELVVQPVGSWQRRPTARVGRRRLPCSPRGGARAVPGAGVGTAQGRGPTALPARTAQRLRRPAPPGALRRTANTRSRHRTDQPHASFRA